MRALAVLRSLGPIDTRSIARDSLLRWLVLLTLPFGLLFRFGIPPITAELDQRLGFDLVPYYPLVMSTLGVLAAGFIGAVIGFLLLDQRDDQTLPALLVTPLSLGEYLRYRLAVPTVLSLLLTMLMFPLAGLTRVTVTQILLSSLCGAPLAALYTLFIGSFAANKVQGLALSKAVGVLGPPAIAAYFVPWPWQLPLAFVPHYWPLKVFWLCDEGAGNAAFAVAGLGIAYQGMLVWLLARRFARVVRR